VLVPANGLLRSPQDPVLAAASHGVADTSTAGNQHHMVLAPAIGLL